MDNPFYYGEEVSGEYFTDRESEAVELARDLARGQNVIVYSPRRYGKTSLIKRVLQSLSDRGFLTFYVNLYAATSKNKFADIYARAIAKGTRGKLDEVIVYLKELFPRMLPKVVIKGEGGPEFEFDYNKDPKSLPPLFADLYEAVERYAVKKKKRAVIAFDEFQEILNLEDEDVERSMRGVIQTHKKTAYVFMGSRRHMMQKLFNDAERPFYKSGRTFPLGKIEPKEFSKFIVEKFRRGKIKIKSSSVEQILNISECHPYYTQMLSSVLWDRSIENGVVTSEGIQKAVEELISRESYMYTTIWDGLTMNQRMLLEALAKGSALKLYSKEFVMSSGIGSSSLLQKAIVYLEERGIVYKENGSILFSDIFFRQWILSTIAI